MTTYRFGDGRIIRDRNTIRGCSKLLADHIDVELGDIPDHLIWYESGEPVIVRCSDIFGIRDNTGYLYFDKADREWQMRGGNELLIVNESVYSLAPSGDGYDFICRADDDLFEGYIYGERPLESRNDYGYPEVIFQIYIDGEPTGVFTVI